MKYAGFDVGSDTVNAVVLDEKGDVVYSPKSLMHFGNPVDTLKLLYEEIIKKFGDISVAFTGSAGKLIAKVTNCPYYYDTISIPAGAEIIAPKAEYIFHMGSTDPYFFEKIVDNEPFVVDHGTGTKCGGGSGILINKQVRRFFADECLVKLKDDKLEDRKLLQEQLEQMHKKAFENIKNSSKDIDVGGRCGVVIQSDMIHLQNSGEQIQNILKGMYKRIAKNYKSDVIRTRVIQKRTAIATGGVFLNEFMVKALEEQLNIKIDLPENFDKIGAIGAALKVLKEKKKVKLNLKDLNKVLEAQKQEIQFAPALSDYLDKVKSYSEEEAIKKVNELIIYKNYSGDVIIGMDGGSTTTKALITDMDLNIIAEICLDTDGKPLETAQKLFKEIRENLNLNIKGIAYTGSSGAFYHKLFTDFKKQGKSSDIVKDEITCHALGVKHFNEKVDTIFECGGQDAKFTLFNKDTVKKAKMNLSCMAGTGQSMKNMLDMLGFDFESFKEYALAAKRTPVADETCAIFTEAGILKLVALGFPKEEIAAGIAYGFMGGYANKFVGNEKFGEFASAQGGPFKGLACLAALAQHTGMEVHAFPHRQLFGAFGAAIAIKKELEGTVCKFRGLDIADMTFEKIVDNCSKVVKESCGVRDCKLQVYKIGDDSIYSGGLCPKGNTDFSIKRAPDYVAMYKKLLDRYLEKFTKPIYESNGERVLIPRSLTFLNEKGIFYAALYKKLGFDVAISPESDDEIANLGIAASHSETCYPVKLAHGHVAWLKKHLREGQDKILLVNPIGSDKEKLKFCPYVAAAGFLTKDALQIKDRDVLLPVLHFNDPDNKVEDAIKTDLDRVFGKRFSKDKIKTAIKKAEKEQKEFLESIYQKGEEILKNLKEKVFIGIGRGYTILDNKASSKVHELFASYGLHFIPSFFLRTPDYDIKNVTENMYWYQGQSMLKYNIMTAIKKNLYPVRETNFNCGTDSIMIYHEEDIMNKAEKPHLVLQTDGHNSNAQFGTRTLANAEVVKKHVPKEIKLEEFNKKLPKVEIRNYIGMPYMGDGSYALAAAFRGFNYKAEVMPTYTKESQYFAKKLVSTNTCRPFSFQIGDSLAWLNNLKKKGIDPNKEAVLFQPKAKGPCRQGQYYVVLRKFLDENGFKEVPILSPDADEDYTNVPISKSKLVKLSALSYKGIFCSDLLYCALLRTRPYEKTKGSADNEYELLRNELYNLIENNSSTKRLIEFMKEAKNRFESLLETKERKPCVVVNGEIFVRCHKNANQDSIRLLEKYGLEVILNPPSQWLEYVNKIAIGWYKNTKELKRLATSLIKKWYIKNITKKLREPFKEFLKGRESHDPEHVINASQKDLIYEKRIGGEAPLSIGEAYLFSKGDFGDICGIYHVGPFGCMQETVATSKINAIIQKHRKKNKIIPFMDAVFGDSELPNLEAEIAAFAEKCYLKKKLNKSI